MIILGIETSCDETAAAIVTDTREILSNVVLSQLEEHRIFGGVVPEIAARAHLDHLDTIITAALRGANLTLKDIDGIAATCGPGLIGGLLVGAVTAKTLASTLKIPFLAINHLEGHALTPRLTDNIAFPYLLLLISGGHTQILAVEGVGQYHRWGTTLDDAAGECFDKSAKLMDLPFPGGPNLEKEAKNCRNTIAARNKFPLPSPMKGRAGCDFSFSGLKTSVRNSVDKIHTPEDKSDLAASFQDTVADILADRCRNAMKRFTETYSTPNPTLVVAGGVSANQVLRTRLEAEAANHHFALYAPPLSLCGDNAAMIAWAGLERLRLGLTDSLTTPARPRWPLDPAIAPRPSNTPKEQNMKKQDFEKKFLPLLLSNGFNIHPDENASQTKTFPFGRIMRPTTSGIHQIEIQIDKYSADHFRIYFGIIPLAGVNAPHAGLIAAKDMLVTWLPEYCILYRSKLFFRQLRREDLDNSEGFIEEIELYFKHGKIGKRTRRIHAYKPQPLDPAS